MLTDHILQCPSPEALARAIEENAIQGVQSWGAWAGMEVHDETDLVWSISNVPFPLFNNIFRTRIAPEQVDARVDALLTRAGAQNVPLAWWTGPTTVPADIGAHLESKGFVHSDDPPGMATDLLSLDDNVALPPGLVVQEVKDVETLKTWCRISAEIFELPPFAGDAWYEMFASVPFGPGQAWRHYLGALEGAPVGTSSIFYAAGVAGISSVTTVPEARRRGIGSALTLGPLKEARRLGYRFATLFSSEMAVPIYHKLGFREYCQGSLYIWMNE